MGNDSPLVTALRFITPVGVLVIATMVIQINSNLDRNCDATQAVSIVTLGLVAADNDVTASESDRLRLFLKANAPDCDSPAIPLPTP